MMQQPMQQPPVQLQPLLQQQSQQQHQQQPKQQQQQQQLMQQQQQLLQHQHQLPPPLQQLQPCTATPNGNPIGIGVIDAAAGENRDAGHERDSSLGLNRGGREERLEGTALAPRGQLDLHGGAEGAPFLGQSHSGIDPDPHWRQFAVSRKAGASTAIEQAPPLALRRPEMQGASLL